MYRLTKIILFPSDPLVRGGCVCTCRDPSCSVVFRTFLLFTSGHWYEAPSQSNARWVLKNVATRHCCFVSPLCSVYGCVSSLFNCIHVSLTCVLSLHASMVGGTKTQGKQSEERGDEERRFKRNETSLPRWRHMDRRPFTMTRSSWICCRKWLGC